MNLAAAKENLKRAYDAGTILAVGTGSGSPLLIHGPALHRELQLWVGAGIPAKVALQAATANGAKMLGTADHAGFIRKGLRCDAAAGGRKPSRRDRRHRAGSRT